MKKAAIMSTHYRAAMQSHTGFAVSSLTNMRVQKTSQQIEPTLSKPLVMDPMFYTNVFDQSINLEAGNSFMC